MAGLLDTVRTQRASAYASAAEVLSALSFEEREGRVWFGTLESTDGTRHEIELQIPKAFPDELPHVKLVFKEPQDLVAHVDRFGTVCIATDSGVLIDTSRPDAVVRDVLLKASEVLSLQGEEREKEILREITSYWIDSGDEFYSLCHPERQSGKAGQVELGITGKPLLVADSCETATSWAKKCGWSFRRPREAYFLRLTEARLPPPYKHVLTFKDLQEWLGESVREAELAALKAWVKKAGVPATVLLSMPIDDGTRRAVLGLRVLPPRGKVLADAQRGFRDDKAPTGLLFSRAEDVNTSRVTVNRLDSDYLLRRGGVSVDLRSKRIAVIGCGAVGSHVAHALAQSGVGTLRLIDDETLGAGNIHRHLLGARFIGESKVRSIRTRLLEDFPMADIIPITGRVQDILRDRADTILNSDAVVVALGDETLERGLNDTLRDKVPRVHTWIEPYGIAGHVLITGLPKRRGCYGCLFERDDGGALFNAANVTRSGQQLQQTLDGCTGTFTPYGAMDAQITAIHASRAAIELAQGKHAESTLISWMGDKGEFLGRGFEFSKRASQLEKGPMTNTTFARGDCEFCHV